MKALILALFVSLALLSNYTTATAATTNLYFTQFESSEGYSTNFSLIGQDGWDGSDFTGNGIVPNYIPGQGQQAYIGAFPPNPADFNLFLWRPINFNPIAAGYPVVKFSVLLNIVDSTTTTNRDAFRWSVYNQAGNRLFSIEFSNRFLDVGYRLDGTNGLTLPDSLFFDNDVNYTLNVTMNFASNRWSATYNDILIATNAPITTVNAPLTLGDIDAVWAINQVNNTNAPGDNYMLFDNYRITAENKVVTPAQVQFLGRTGEGWALLRVFGDNNSRWALDATTNFVNWTAVKTNPIAGTYSDVIDTGAAGHFRRFYRARHVP